MDSNITNSFPIVKCMHPDCSVLFNGESLPYSLKGCTDNCVFCKDCLQTQFNQGYIHCIICNESREASSKSCFETPIYLKTAIHQYYLQSTRSQICKIHESKENNLLSLFCGFCNTVICQNCAFTEHKTHISEICLLEEQVAKKKKIIEDLLKNVKREISAQKSMYHQLEKENDNLKKTKDKVLSQFAKTIQRMRETITNRFLEYQDQSKEYYDTKKNALGKDKSALERNLEKLDDFESSISNYIVTFEKLQDFAKFLQNVPELLKYLKNKMEDMSKQANFPSTNDDFCQSTIPFPLNLSNFDPQNVESLIHESKTTTTSKIVKP